MGWPGVYLGGGGHCERRLCSPQQENQSKTTGKPIETPGGPGSGGWVVSAMVEGVGPVGASVAVSVVCEMAKGLGKRGELACVDRGVEQVTQVLCDGLELAAVTVEVGLAGRPHFCFLA